MAVIQVSGDKLNIGGHGIVATRTRLESLSSISDHGLRMAMHVTGPGRSTHAGFSPLALQLASSGGFQAC